MGCDIVVALGRATATGQTLFGLNAHRPPKEPQTLVKIPGRSFALGELVHTQFLELPQVRQTFTVLGSQPLGLWGYQHGLNEHQVAVGCASWRSRLERPQPGLLGPDLVRLTLERSRCASQALDVLTNLIERHGQGQFPSSVPGWATDNVFLIADAHEAFTVEAAGAAWAAQEIAEVRAVSDVSVIRQDWDRIARGLGSHAIAQGWWPEDGSKLDFAMTLAKEPTGRQSALRRWGRATLLLEEQNPHIDETFLRRLLGDHYAGKSFEVRPTQSKAEVTPLCQHGATQATVASMVAALGSRPEHLPVAWCAFGPPCISIHFPIFLDGRLPAALSESGTFYRTDSLWWRTHELLQSLGSDRDRWQEVDRALEQLQARFDSEAEEAAAEARSFERQGEPEALERLATSLMQNHVERYEETLDELLPAPVGAGRDRW